MAYNGRSAIKLIAKLLSSGGHQVDLHKYQWDLSGGCQAPVDVLLRAERDGSLNSPTLAMLEVTLITRCRKCEWCRVGRSIKWAKRAIIELASSRRSWFLTWTVSPANQQISLEAARSWSKARSLGDFEALSPNEQLLSRHWFIGQEFTSMFKRMRKAGAKFRYLVVLEVHKSGLPHYHGLLHEIGEWPLTKRFIQSSWTMGFSNCKLVDGDPRAAKYVTKYLGKATCARVRASVAYGLYKDCTTYGPSHDNGVYGATLKKQPVLLKPSGGSDANISSCI